MRPAIKSKTVRNRRLRYPGDRKNYLNDLRHSITLQRQSKDEHNRPVYIDMDTVWAGLEQHDEKEDLDSNQYVATADYEFRIRHRTDLTTKDRIKRTLDGEDVFYGITGLRDPMGDRRYLLVRAKLTKASF